MIAYAAEFVLTAAGSALGIASLIEGARDRNRLATLSAALALTVSIPLQVMCVWRMLNPPPVAISITPTMGAVLVAPPTGARA